MILAVLDVQVALILSTSLTCQLAFWFRRSSDFQDWGHGSHLGFLIRTILASFYLHVGLSVKQKYLEIDFKDGGHSGNLGFLIKMILAIFDLQVAPILPTKFQINELFDLEEEAQKGFKDNSHGGHLRLPIGKILDI